MIRWARTLAIAIILVSPPLVATSAHADECPPLDPLCVVGTVEDTGDTAQDAVEEAANTARDTATNAVDAIGSGNDPGIGPGDEPSIGSNDGPGRGSRPKDARPPGHDTSIQVPRPLDRRIDRAPVPGTPASTGDDPWATTPGQDPPPSSTARLVGHLLVGTVNSIALLALSIALMLGFLAFQDRLDRRDLALTRSRPHRDLVPFT